MTFFLSALLVAALAFCIGSVPFGLLIGKTFCGVDPRHDGSKNVGATNVARLCGFKWGVLTLLCDILKGFLPVYFFTALTAGMYELAYPAGLAVICGHMFSLFLQYKGGKGVATTVGVFLALCPLQLVLAALVCVLVIWRSGFVSAGSLTLVSALPVLCLLSGRTGDAYFSLLVAVLVIYAHRENIRRLLRGEEKAWLSSKSS